MSFDRVVAIDGPSGAGKSTITKALAEKLNLLYIDTGAMYRALAIYVHRLGIPFEDCRALQDSLDEIDLEYGTSKEKLIIVNGEDFTHLIRENQVSIWASHISQLQSVREYLLEFQRSLVTQHVCVVEGRDIGTVVFPHSFCKIFLTASPEVRAERRVKQLESSGQKDFNFEEILEEVVQRDQRDREREISPLKMANDAVLVETDHMNTEEAIEHLAGIVKEKAKLISVDL